MHGTVLAANSSIRERSTLSGVLRSVTYSPPTAPPELSAELYDGSGSIDLVWLGRRDIPGIEPGRRLLVTGRVAPATPGTRRSCTTPPTRCSRGPASREYHRTRVDHRRRGTQVDQRRRRARSRPASAHLGRVRRPRGDRGLARDGGVGRARACVRGRVRRHARILPSVVASVAVALVATSLGWCSAHR